MSNDLQLSEVAEKAVAYKRRLHHYETDADGVCHFSNYLRFLEEAFSENLRSIDFSPERLAHGFAVTEVKATYRAPLRYGDYFEVALLFTSVRRAALIVQALVLSEQGVCATITGTFAAIDRNTNTSTPLDLRLRQCLAPRRQDTLQEESKW